MMLETVRIFDCELKRDPYIWKMGRGWGTALELFVGLSFWPLLAFWIPLVLLGSSSWPFWPLLALWAPLGLIGPSWPLEPLLPCWALIGLLSPYWPLGPLLLFLALLGFFGPSWSFWPPYVFSSLLDNLDARNHKTNLLRSYYWLFGYVDFLGVARQVLLLPWKIVDICTYSGLFSSRHVGILKNVLRH